MIEITPLREDDRQAWQPLAVGYNAFYERVLPDATYDHVWRRLMEAQELHGLGARLDGRVVGIAHYLFHTNVWVDEVCYLADLFVDEHVRGQGAARLLIEAVADQARKRGCARYYWLTQQHNVRARGLYDKVARFAGFIRYDYPMNPHLISGLASGSRRPQRRCRHAAMSPRARHRRGAGRAPDTRR